MSSRSHTESKIPDDAIAIVGMAVRVPGANSPDELWRNLIEGKETIRQFSRDELVFPEESDADDYVSAKGIVDDVDKFDAAFFNMLPREAELTDPQQRVFTELAWEAMERSGARPSDGHRIGVYVSSYMNSYMLANLCTNRAFLDETVEKIRVGSLQTEIGNDKDYISTRVSFKLDLHGPSMTVGTACSGSLVAVAQACKAIRDGSCDMALAGGVAITVPQERGYVYTDKGIASKDGHCRVFDEKATGTVFSNGAGVVMLKRYSAAVADRDRIHAVIRGVGLNNDGNNKLSYAAPSVKGQVEVIRMAQQDAGINPRSITAIETHGTGTPVGDPVEVRGLTRAFREAGIEENGFCSLGSLKSYIGHLDAGSGVCGLIKMTLSLENKTLPGLLHFEKAHPKIDFETSPFFATSEVREWERGPNDEPRRGAVSSYGVGGTNAHLVLEEAPGVSAETSKREEQLFLVSAKTETALETAAGNVAAFVEDTEEELADVGYTLATGREYFKHRRALVGDASVTGNGGYEKSPINFMFAGQGSQHIGMTRSLYASEPRFRELVDRCCDIVEPTLGLRLTDILFPDKDANVEALTEQLKDTELAQPAIFIVEYAIADLWMSWGIKPAALIGHSVGEFVAACHAGVFTLKEALEIITTRGRLMSALPGGGMLSVRLPENELIGRIPDALDLATVNGPALCVVAGPHDELDAFRKALEADAIVAQPLHTSHAFHSRMMDPVIDEFVGSIEKIDLRAPQIPIMSTVTGEWLTEELATDPKYWARHLRETVRFSQALIALGEEGERQIFIESAPGQTLTSLALQSLDRKECHLVAASCKHVKADGSDYATVLESLGKLWTRGVKIDWSAFFSHEDRGRVPLPTYPFERKRYWVEPTPATINQQGAVGDLTPLGTAPLNPAPAETLSLPDTKTTQLMSNTDSRIDSIAAEVRTVLTNLSGIPENEMDGAATFMELGFDSLLLTQVSKAFQDGFGTEVNMRQLMTDFSSINAFSNHLDVTLDPDRFRVAVVPAPSQAPAPVAAAVATPVGVVDSSIQSVIDQQMEIMRQQLALLQSGAVSQPAAPVPTPMAAPRPAPAPTPAKEPAPKSSAPTTAIDISSDDFLTEQQRRHVDQLVAKYTAKTARSKVLTTEYREQYADPRTVSGFNRLWKEMIYQIVVTKSKGTRLLDVDGNEYIDILNGFGPGFFGHSPDFITDALHAQLDQGVATGPQCLEAMEAARLFCETTGNERASFVNTGSEGVQAAMRLSRTVTGRDKIVVFAKDYHGNFDEVLVRGVGSGDKLRSMPVAPGIPNRAVDDIIVLPYGADESLEIIRKRGKELAAVIVEPVQSRLPEFQPKEFVQELRKITTDSGAALVFDEVITGFRAGPQGAQGYYGVDADIAVYGKIIGGGMPIGVVAGKAKYMDTFDGGMWQYGDDSFPEQGVTFFAGTFVRHPLAMVAVKQMLLHMRERGAELWSDLEEKANRLAQTVNQMFVDNDIPFRFPNFKSLLFLRHIGEEKYANLFFFHLREKGVFLLEGFPCYLTTAHTDADIDYVISAFRESIAEMQEAGFFPRPENSDIPPLNGSRLTGPERQLDVDSAPIEKPAPRIYPLTEPLTEIWLASRVDENASLCFNEVVALTLKGDLESDALKLAMQDLVDRHEGLRAVFPADEEGFSVLPQMDVTLTVLDVSSESETEIERIVSERLDGERNEGFDLAGGPLFRAQLIKISPDKHTLILNAHHIVCDGWSYNVLVDDLSHFYASRIGKAADRLPAPLRFGSYAAKAVNEETLSVGNDSEKFWLDQFSEPVLPLDLPLDVPRSEEADYRTGTASATIDAEMLGKMKMAAGKSGATLFAFLINGYQILLHQISRQERLMVAFPVAGQNRGGNQNLVGHCVSFLPLVADIDRDETFESALSKTQEKLLNVFEHQDYTFGQLIKKLDAADRPKVEAVFNLERVDGYGEFSGLETEVHEVHRLHAINPLFLNVVESDSGLEMNLTFQTGLFLKETVDQWLATYCAMLEKVVADRGATVAEIASAITSEQRELLEQWNDTATDYPREKSISDLFAEVVEARASATAIRQDGASMTYAELNTMAESVAARLARDGAAKGDRVALLLERSPEAVAGLLGTLKLGAVCVPLDPEYPNERIELILEDSGAKFILTRTELPTDLFVNEAAVIRIDADDTPPLVESTKVASTDPAYILYTSGSTGKPKGAVIPHRAIVRLVRDTNYCEFGENETILHAASPCFDASTFEIYGALLNGGILALPPSGPFSVDAIATTIRDCGVTTLWLTSGLFQVMVDERPEAFAKVRQLLTGGDVLSSDHGLRLLERFSDIQLINGYGPTENTTFTTYHQITRKDLNRASIPIGRPISNSTAWILDAAGEPVAPGIAGELYSGGDGLGLEYLNRPELTAEKFVNHPSLGRLYRTGDLSRYRANGEIEFLGRIDNQVKIRGYRVEPREIEATLTTFPLVQQCKVVVRGSGAAEKSLVAYVTPENGRKPDVVEMTEFLRGKFPGYMVPSACVVVDVLPVNGSGKVDVKALPEPTKAQQAGDVRTLTNTESVLIGMWKNLLSVDEISPTDDFFDLGGHSLLGMRLFARIQEEFEVKLALGTIFRAPTVRTLAGLIDQEKPEIEEPKSRGISLAVAPDEDIATTTVAIQPHGDLPPLFAVHGGDGGVVFYRGAASKLEKNRPFYAFEAPALTASGPIPEETIETTATRYLAEMRKVQPIGPYHLCGYSFGGVVAYEMAAQLGRLGEDVCFLGLFDTENPAVEVQPLSITQRIALNWEKRNDEDAGVLEKVSNLSKRFGSGLAYRLRAEVQDAAARRLPPPDTANWLRLSLLRQAHEAAMDAYKPTSWNGNMTLFRAMVGGDKFDMDDDYGWSSVVEGTVETLDVPGNHISLFHEKNVDGVAAALRASLDKVSVESLPA